MEDAVQSDVHSDQQPPRGPPSATTGLARCLQEESCHYCSAKLDCNDASANSTPFVSAPSSPRKSTPFASYLTQTTLDSSQACDTVEYDAAISAYAEADTTSPSSPSLSEFEFSLRFSEEDTWFNPSRALTPMSSAEELFHNGKIRPLNTRLCSSSYCICFGDGTVFNDGYQDQQHPDVIYADRLPLPHAEHHQQQQQHPSMVEQRLRHTKPTALEQWKKSMGSRYEKGHLRHAHGQHVEKVMQLSSLPLAYYRNCRHEGGHHRRARSLSPLRVFHMDEKMMHARASSERDMHTSTKTSSALVDGAGTILRPRRSRKSWTLKELLNMGVDNRVHDKRPQLVQANGAEPAKFGCVSAFQRRVEEIEASSKSAKDNVGKRSLEEERLHGKSSTDNKEARSPWNILQERADQYSCSIGSEDAQVEEMEKRNVLHYKKSLLGCLGFTSKLHSLKGLQNCMSR